MFPVSRNEEKALRQGGESAGGGETRQRGTGAHRWEEDESLVLELLGTLVESLGREESGGHGCKVTRFGCGGEMRSDGLEASGGAEHATITLIRVGSRKAPQGSKAVRET